MCLTLNNNVVKDFIDWYKHKRPEYLSWNIRYFLPTIRIKITVPEGIEIDADYEPTKIIGLGFAPTDFKKIIHLFGETPNAKLSDDEAPTPFLFSENIWLVDEERKHHLIVGYIIRKIKTLILLQFWLRAEGMHDLIRNSPIGIVFFPIERPDKREAFETVSRIIQSGVGEYKLVIADLEPFKYEEPMTL